MLMHPDLIWTQAKQHQQELIAQADRHRLLNSARRARWTRAGRGDPADNAGARGRPAGNLASCPPRAAAPAQP